MGLNTSILPEDYLEKRVARRTNLICLLLFFVVMAGVVGAYVVTGRQQEEIDHLNEKVKIAYADAHNDIQALEEMQTQRDKMLGKAQVTSALKERVPRTVVFSEIINRMPQSMRLIEFELETETQRNAGRARSSIQRRQEQRANAQAEADAENEDAIIELPPTTVSVRLVGYAATDVEVSQFIAALQLHDLFERVELKFTEEATVEENVLRKFELNMVVNQDIDVQTMNLLKVRRGATLDTNPMDTPTDQVFTPQVGDPAPAPAVDPAGDTTPAPDANAMPMPEDSRAIEPSPDVQN